MGMECQLSQDRPFAHFSGALPLIDPNVELLAFAAQLGTVQPRWFRSPRVEALRIVRQGEARPRSLSAVCGPGEQPLHTDLAHWRIPLHFIAFACATPDADSRPTLVLPWSHVIRREVEWDLIRDAVFKVRNGRRTFYAHVRDDKRRFFRFDPGCMVPANGAAQDFVRFYEDACAIAEPTAIVWSPGDVLVIDNWNALHARSRGPSSACAERRLLRVQCGQGTR